MDATTLRCENATLHDGAARSRRSTPPSRFGFDLLGLPGVARQPQAHQAPAALAFSFPFQHIQYAVKKQAALAWPRTFPAFFGFPLLSALMCLLLRQTQTSFHAGALLFGHDLYLFRHLRGYLAVLTSIVETDLVLPGLLPIASCAAVLPSQRCWLPTAIPWEHTIRSSLHASRNSYRIEHRHIIPPKASPH